MVLAPETASHHDFIVEKRNGQFPLEKQHDLQLPLPDTRPHPETIPGKMPLVPHLTHPLPHVHVPVEVETIAQPEEGHGETSPMHGVAYGFSQGHRVL